MLPQQYPQHIYIIGGVIALLFLIFLFKYLLPGWLFWFRLKKAIKNIRKIKSQGGFSLSAAFANDRILAHLWAEYEETLHEQRRTNALTAIDEVVAVRATLPAEVYFSPENLIDSRLHVEFFKHLPGLFTGVGIIGTFLGLINGLKSFEISENPSVVRGSLDSLLHGVHEAFFVSASAIALAMLVTFLEKWLLAGLHRQVQELCYLIDSFFEAGAGEEYLARLVKAFEESASQSKILKDALVGELKQILSEISQQQISAAHESQQRMAEKLVESIESGIRQPITQLVDGFSVQQERSSQHLSGALSDVLAAFIQKTEDIFGGQISGIHSLQQKTVESLESAIAQFGQLAASIDSAGRNATDNMADKLAEAMNAMEVRQQAMNTQMAEFVGQLRGMVADSQNETGQKLQTLLGDLGQQVVTMVSALEAQTNRQADLHASQQQQLTSHMAGTLESVAMEMRNAMQSLSTEVSGAVGSLEQRSIDTSRQLAEQQGRFANASEQSVTQLAQTVDAVASRMTDETSASLGLLSTEMRNTMQALSAQVSGTVGSLEQRSVDTSRQFAEQQGRFANASEHSVAQLAQMVDALTAKLSNETSTLLERLADLIQSQQVTSAEAVRAMQSTVAGMRETTDSTVTKMNQGADTLFLAADEFSKAGKGVSGVLSEATGLARELSSSAGSVTTAARSIEGMIGDYRSAQASLTEMVGALNDTVDSARQEASLTRDALARIEGAAEKLAAAQHQADRYLDDVSRVLAEAHQAFAANMRTTIGEANKQFYDSLSQATSLLRESVEELDAALSGVGSVAKH